MCLQRVADIFEKGTCPLCPNLHGSKLKTVVTIKNFSISQAWIGFNLTNWVVFLSKL